MYYSYKYMNLFFIDLRAQKLVFQQVKLLLYRQPDPQATVSQLSISARFLGLLALFKITPKTFFIV